jgi:O-antigen ligase
MRVLVPLVAAAVVVGVVLLPPETFTRISSLGQTTNVQRSLVVDTSFRGRFVENVTALHMFEDHPVLGVGSGNFPTRYADYSTFTGREWRPVRKPHNLYLEAFAETGVVGGTVFVLFIWLTVSGVWRARRQVDPRALLLVEGAFAGLAGVLVTSLFLHGDFPSTLWTAIGLAWAAAAMARTAARVRAPEVG